MFNGLAALPLVLCVATVAIWIRSYYGGDEIFYHREIFAHHPDGATVSAETHYWIATLTGTVTLYAEVTPISPVWDGPQQNQSSWHIGYAHGKRLATGEFEANGLDSSLVRRKWGLTFDREFGGSFWLVGAPIWLIACATAIFPVVQFGRWRQRQRSRKVRACSKCGYNLTGNISGVCPECGTAIEKI
jgi:hypothetical protein